MSTFLEPSLYEAAAMHQAELRDAAPLALESDSCEPAPRSCWIPAARPCLLRLGTVEATTSQNSTVSWRRSASEGEVVKTRHEPSLDRRNVEFIRVLPLDDPTEEAVVPVVLKREHASRPIDIDDDVAGRVGNEARCHVAGHRFDEVLNFEGLRWAWIAGREFGDLLDHAMHVCFTNSADYLDRAAEMLDRLVTDVWQKRSLAACADDSASAVNPRCREREQRLPRKVSDRLPGIGASEDEESDVRVREDIRDHALNAQVLGLQGADDRDIGIRLLGERGHEGFDGPR
jgi:hypothetical protein